MQLPMNFPLFDTLVSLLLLVFGFLLNRVFQEIDRAQQSNGKLKEMLMQECVSKDDFVRHLQQEERSLERLTEEIGRRFDKLDVLIEAIRVKQQTRAGD